MFDLDEMIRQHEGKMLEFKRNFSSPGNVMGKPVAFANGTGGRLPIGVEDGSRKVVGAPMPELNSEAIVFRAASECLAPVRRLTRRGPHSLQLTTRYQGRES